MDIFNTSISSISITIFVSSNYSVKRMSGIFGALEKKEIYVPPAADRQSIEFRLR
jgi:hypothetical protein